MFKSHTKFKMFTEFFFLQNIPFGWNYFLEKLTTTKNTEWKNNFSKYLQLVNNWIWKNEKEVKMKDLQFSNDTRAGKVFEIRERRNGITVPSVRKRAKQLKLPSFLPAGKRSDSHRPAPLPSFPDTRQVLIINFMNDTKLVKFQGKNNYFFFIFYTCIKKSIIETKNFNVFLTIFL